MQRDEILALVEFDTNGGCWFGPMSHGPYSQWTGAISGHRASYECFVGPIPDGFIVRHKCDVKCCINPNHLQIGTYKENSADHRRAKEEKPAVYDSMIKAERLTLNAKRAASAARREALGRSISMTPAELRSELGRLNLSRAAAARALRVGERTFYAYANGEAEIPKVIRLALLGLEMEASDDH